MMQLFCGRSVGVGWLLTQAELSLTLIKKSLIYIYSQEDLRFSSAVLRWLGSRVVSVLDSGAEGRG